MTSKLSFKEIADENAAETERRKLAGVSTPGEKFHGWASLLIVGILIVGAVALTAIQVIKGDPPESACIGDWTHCSDFTELRCTYANFYKMQSACRDAADRRARYGSPDWPFLGGPFYDTGWLDKGRGTATLIDERVTFENGFGARENVRATCIYDLAHSSATDIRIEPRRG